jgi:hypothetical protein
MFYKISVRLCMDAQLKCKKKLLIQTLFLSTFQKGKEYILY